VAPRFLRPLTHLAPHWLRRAGVGAIEDLKSLPARAVDPEARAEPWRVLHHVGGGGYLQIGRYLADLLTRHAGFDGTQDVLDIGCGTGRAAAGLDARLAASGGSYLGFDVSASAIRYCRRRFAGEHHLRFEHLDVRHPDYNPRGRLEALSVVFPAADAAFDLALAASVFTHLRMPAVRRYLAETARTLRPGGRLAFTAFSLEPGRQASARFPFQPFDETSSVVDPQAPEGAIGHRREVLEAAVREAGFKSFEFHRGDWAPGADYAGGQDLYVATRA
jgi:SAM-dependent methyltransferase